jgi:hypothetical protein
MEDKGAAAPTGKTMSLKPRAQRAPKKSRPRRAPLKLIQGQDFERAPGGEIVIPVSGFERMAEAILSGREVTAAVDDTVVLRVKAK